MKYMRKGKVVEKPAVVKVFRIMAEGQAQIGQIGPGDKATGYGVAIKKRYPRLDFTQPPLRAMLVGTHLRAVIENAR